MITVLLVLNDLHEATEFSAVLREYGHAVLCERDARSALATLEHEWVDALVCDAVVPDLICSDLITAARMNLGRPQLPAVVLTSAPLELGSQLPADERVTVLAAPVTPDKVAAELAKFRIVQAGQDRRKRSARLVDYRRRWDDPCKDSKT